MNRNEAERILQDIFKIPHFYDQQWMAIDRILRGERILMIQRTGFGKSLCYQFPATQLEGVTVVFSPLIALMRDQVKALEQKGIPAAFINSEQSDEENTVTMAKALRGEIKILYIAPERQENQKWIDVARQLHIAMVVIDEAHTVSTWGHDFRPSFRRIINLVQQLPDTMPILATTATATKKVQADIEKQIGGKLTTLRGSLRRDNFELYVVRVRSENEKMLWLAQHLNEIPGTGLIYTGTRVATEEYSKWLQFVGIDCVQYNAGLDPELRKEIEVGLMSNRWKCIVSTNALGMGIDKPDIRFVIHTQIPQSLIHYYQEIGRGGRDGKPTKIVLLYNITLGEDGVHSVDYELPRRFIDQARPSLSLYHRVIEILKDKPFKEREIIKKANLKTDQIRLIRADLIEQGIVKEVTHGREKFYEYQYNAPELDSSRFQELRLSKLKDLDAMVNYVTTRLPRMKVLCSFLDSDEADLYANCDNTDLRPWNTDVSQILVSKLVEYQENDHPTLPTGKNGTKMDDGFALSYYGHTTIGRAIHKSKYEGGGDFPDYMVKMLARVFRSLLEKRDFDIILFVPPTHSGKLVEHFVNKFASEVGLPYSCSLCKTRATEEQKCFQNTYNKRDNVAGAFDVPQELVKNKKILLIDDIYMTVALP